MTKKIPSPEEIREEFLEKALPLMNQYINAALGTDELQSYSSEARTEVWELLKELILRPNEKVTIEINEPKDILAAVANGKCSIEVGTKLMEMYKKISDIESPTTDNDAPGLTIAVVQGDQANTAIKRINGRNKGAAGEREAAKWLQSKFNLQNTPQRNLEQTRSGGHDLTGFEPFLVEVKRQEVISLRKWWVQAVTSSKNIEGSIPIVMYRQNRRPWRFLISATYIGCRNGYIILEEREFEMWAKSIINT